MNTQELLQLLMRVCADAGREMVHLQQQNSFSVQHKSDQSPVTNADTNTDTLLRAAIAKARPGAVIVSEESSVPDFAIRSQAKELWLIDPLDGTREYIKGSPDFTINLAQLINGRTELAVLTAPAHGEVYFAVRGQGAFQVKSDQKLLQLQVRPLPEDTPVVLISRSHRSVEFELLQQFYPLARSQQMGSSLKFCRVARGDADVYMRLFPTCEWDTAAGQFILEEAGGIVLTIEGEPLTYNRKDLANPPFIAFADPLLEWESLMSLARKRRQEALERK